jgi:branched-subunit amino acid aminotransferase/4-amino-4-deoxychorismate lyase
MPVGTPRTDDVILRAEVDGAVATAEQLLRPAMANYGHFTAMQVRGGAVRGLQLHLTRLDVATREVFGTGLDGGLVRARIRHALQPTGPDASVRVYVFQPDTAGESEDAEPPVMVVVRPPGESLTGPYRLLSVPYQRPLAHLKHLGTFGQTYYGRVAKDAGYDEALLTGDGGVIAEGAITNVGFFDGSAVVWPSAPHLAGITMQLVTTALAERGTRSQYDTVRIADVPQFASAFVTNSRGVAPVERIDDQVLSADAGFAADLAAAYEAVPWDPI